MGGEVHQALCLMSKSSTRVCDGCGGTAVRGARGAHDLPIDVKDKATALPRDGTQR